MKRGRTDWIVCENTPDGGYLNRCLRCGETETMKVPVPVEAFVLRLKAFGKEHERCTPGAPTKGAGGTRV